MSNKDAVKPNAQQQQVIDTVDGAVLVVAGAVLGYQRAVLLFCISLMLTAFVSAVLLLLHKVSGKTRIPYLPFMTTAFLIQKMGVL